MADSATSARQLHCVVVTPERAVLDESADFVALPMYDGELGVLPGRIALIGRLGSGELRIRNGETTRRYFIDGGFVQVKANVVTVLTANARKSDEIDVSAAEQILNEPLRVSATPEDQESQFKTRERARAQLRVVDNEGDAVSS